jgi:hypothetical protein
MAKSDFNMQHPCLQPPHTRVDVAPPEVARRPNVLLHAVAKIFARAQRSS